MQAHSKRIWALLYAAAGLAVAAAAQEAQVGVVNPTDLLARLPASKTLVERAGELRWECEGGPSFRIVDAVEGVAILDIGGKRLQVAGSLLVLEAERALRRLPELLRLADAANLSVESLGYRFAPLLGAHLKSEQAVVLPEGVGLQVDAPEHDQRQGPRALRQAGKNLIATLGTSALSVSGQEAMRRFLGTLHLRDAQVDSERGALPPSAARRMVRAGWLAGFGLDAEAVRAVVASVEAAEGQQPSKLYRGAAGLEMAQLQDSFAPVGVALRSPARSGYVVEVPPPQFFPPGPKALVAVTLAPGSDPAAPDAPILAAEVFVGDRSLVRWSRDGGLLADAQAWQMALPAVVRAGRDNLLADSLPPHVLVTTMNGDVRLLATLHGALVPPRSATVDELERFLADASKVLPDAPCLDLIGNYLFRYAFDSPDPRFPLLVGDQSLNGEIHQDALQTLRTVTGGIVRGDCDDLAELYLTVLERQGKHGHLMSLPRHCAVCWAQQEGERWVSRVLQTGPGMQFVADDLSKSLVLAYQEFSGNEVVDPNQLGILLRFSGENVRTPYVLGWRIFGDPEYSRVMVDVQRDWHLHTYRHGFEKMKALVAAGDEDNANYRELSGLCQATGQFAASAEFLAEAMTRVEAPDAAVNLAVERMSDLFECEQHGAARQLASDILERLLPAAEEALGPAIAAMAMQFVARVLAHDGNADLALAALRTYVATPARERLVLCYRYLSSRQFDANEWAASPMLVQSRDLLATYAGSLIECIESGGLGITAAVQSELETVDNWLAAVAFRSPVEPSDLLEAYAMTARYWRALLGAERFDALVRATDLPTGKPDAAQRSSGFSQLLQDLPWIRISVDYHLVELQEQFGRRAKGFDRDRALRIADALLEARDRAIAAGLFNPRQELFVALARLTKALLQQDEPALRALFTYIREQNDKPLRDLATRWIGNVAPVLDLAWFDSVLAAWRQEVDFKPSYFGIAWGAMLARGPEHALRAAKVAAERFADDPALVAEYAFMRKLLGKE